MRQVVGRLFRVWSVPFCACAKDENIDGEERKFFVCFLRLNQKWETEEVICDRLRGHSFKRPTKNQCQILVSCNLALKSRLTRSCTIVAAVRWKKTRNRGTGFAALREIIVRHLLLRSVGCHHLLVFSGGHPVLPPILLHFVSPLPKGRAEDGGGRRPCLGPGACGGRAAASAEWGGPSPPTAQSENENITRLLIYCGRNIPGPGLPNFF